MSSSPKVQRERKRQGLCVGCGGRPKAGCLRCGSCLEKQREYDKAYRDKQKGAATVEPQCKLPDGKMRADHVFDENGLCDCSARRMGFAPRPALRPEMVRASKAKPTPSRGPVASVVPPPKKPTPTPTIRVKPKVAHKPAEKRIGDTTFRALVEEFERQRAEMDELIVALRKVEEWWPPS